MSIDYRMLFSGPLLFHTKIKDEDIEKLKSISNTNQDFRKHLAASINDEFQLSNLDYQKIVDPYLDVYREAFFEWYSNKIGRPKVVSCWINHMKDGEFNPPHIHTNCNFSSVLFLNDLPEEIKLEQKEYLGTHKGGPASLNFLFGTSKNCLYISEKNINPTKGDFFIFPADLTHWVFPFKSKVIRTSIAANYE